MVVCNNRTPCFDIEWASCCEQAKPTTEKPHRILLSALLFGQAQPGAQAVGSQMESEKHRAHAPGHLHLISKFGWSTYANLLMLSRQ
jgi:hypothetical protein